MKQRFAFIAALAALFFAASSAALANRIVNRKATVASFSDDFNRADETPFSSSNWQTGLGSWGTFGLIGNKALAGGGTNCVARVAPATATFSGDHEASTTIVGGSEGFAGPAVRVQADGSCYTASGWGTGVVSVRKWSGASHSALGADLSATLSAGDILKVRVSGASTVTIEVFVNGVSIGFRTDSSSPHSGGQPGIWAGDSLSVDNFTASNS